ncbi:Oidioi.mRNA.OKI2018_I69.chr2.g4324.t1.cds [Oikopleura dioica]|uniref:Oidioi.mRNA.OKI2018_I69.chr2.g4324.t1.cds n=1 Tax=Oikopleura dioica TaxID=34765 RepID=A0ABN7T619_OIKDI|nr:Oidioi.mRNA.OKI2018_I69.chr2.g4324.t1.cds [Oikopleura dioica]
MKNSVFLLFMSCEVLQASVIQPVDWDSLILGDNFVINREELVMFIDDPSVGDWILPENMLEIFNSTPAFDFNQNTIIESSEIAMQENLLSFVRKSNCPGSCWDFHPSKGCFLESDIFEEKIEHSCLASGVRIEIDECIFDHANEEGEGAKLSAGDCLLEFSKMEMHFEDQRNFVRIELSVHDLNICGISFAEESESLILESSIHLSNEAKHDEELFIRCEYAKTVIKSFMFKTFQMENEEKETISSTETGDLSGSFALDLMGVGPKHDVFIIGSTIYGSVLYDFSETGLDEAPFQFYISDCSVGATNIDSSFPIIENNCPNALASQYLDFELTSDLLSSSDKTFQFKAFGLSGAEAYEMTCSIEICIDSCPTIIC